MTCWRQTKCQDVEEDVNEDDEDSDEAEYDSILIEDAGELLPSIVKVVGGEHFVPHFHDFIVELSKKAVS